MSNGFEIVPDVDSVAPLRSAFPDLWPDLLQFADPETPILMYAGFAELLLQRRNDEVLWARASEFCEELATSGTGKLQDVLRQGCMERLHDSDIVHTIPMRLGPKARALFETCGLETNPGESETS